MPVYPHESYDEYVRENTRLNIEKLPRVSDLIDKYIPVGEYLRDKMPWVKRGICHGSRNGKEIRVLQEYVPECSILGTEISPTATQFPNTIQWDFHNIKEEWLDSVDFVYSNTLDHSHSPEYAISQWVRCLSEKGRAFVEWDVDKGLVENAADCFGATIEEYRDMFQRIGCYDHEFVIADPRTIFVLKKCDIDLKRLPLLNKFSGNANYNRS